jgi:hypothetical protein
MKKKIVSLMFVIVLTSWFAGCQTNEQLAVWPNRDVSIDGKITDWSGYLSLNEDSNMAFGFLRDSSYFYICLVTSDRDIQRQIMGQGLIVWLEADKKVKNRIGVKFPLGMMASGMPPQEFMRGRPEEKGEKMGLMFENALNELEIRIPGEKEFSRYAFSEITESGLEVAAGMKLEQLVYEMKIPLYRGENTPYALGVEPAQLVELEIETPEMDREAMREKMMSMGGGGGRGGSPPGGMSGGGPPGGMSGGGPPGGGMPGGGGPGSGMGPKETEPYKAKFTVRLESAE